MIVIRHFKTWGRVAIVALLPLIVMFPATALANLLNFESNNVITSDYLARFQYNVFSLGLKGAVYGLPICYVMQAKPFAAKLQNVISFIVPAAYLLIIILAYCFFLPLYRFIPQLYRGIGSFTTPVMLAIPYIWRSIELLRKKKTIS